MGCNFISGVPEPGFLVSLSLPPSLPSYLSLYFSLSVPRQGPRGLPGTSRLAVLQFWGAACPSLGVQGAQGRCCWCFFGLDGGRPEFAHCLVVIDAYPYQRGQLFFFFFKPTVAPLIQVAYLWRHQCPSIPASESWKLRCARLLGHRESRLTNQNPAFWASFSLFPCPLFSASPLPLYLLRRHPPTPGPTLACRQRVWRVCLF